jgi:hypothetical protein
VFSGDFACTLHVISSEFLTIESESEIREQGEEFDAGERTEVGAEEVGCGNAALPARGNG